MLGRLVKVAGRRLVTKEATNFSTSSTCTVPAAAEAIEALQHVSEEERRKAREGRLDRDKVSNSNRCRLSCSCSFLPHQGLGERLRFAIVGPDDLETVNKLLYATYHPFEPLTKHLDLCNGPNSLRDVDRMVEEKLGKYLTL